MQSCFPRKISPPSVPIYPDVSRILAILLSFQSLEKLSSLSRSPFPRRGGGRQSRIGCCPVELSDCPISPDLPCKITAKQGVFGAYGTDSYTEPGKIDPGTYKVVAVVTWLDAADSQRKEVWSQPTRFKYTVADIARFNARMEFVLQNPFTGSKERRHPGERHSTLTDRI